MPTEKPMHANDGAHDFEPTSSRGTPTAAGRSGRASGGDAPRPAPSPAPTAKAVPPAKPVAAKHPDLVAGADRVPVTAEGFAGIFAAQSRHAKSRRLAVLCRTEPVVRELVAELKALKEGTSPAPA